MDFWYERVIREMLDVNEEATERRREAEEASGPAIPEPADDDNE
jgi:hypothetical protein